MAATGEQASGDIGERARRLAQLAVRDPETGFHNRLGLEQALIDLERGAAGAVIFAAMAVAPGFLRQALARLSRTEPDWMVGRLAPSVLGLAGAAPEAGAGAARIEAAQAGLAGQGIQTAAGFAAYPQDAADAGALIAHAEFALAGAQAGGAAFSAYSGAQRADADLALMKDLRRGLSAGEVSLLHQPKLDLRSGAVTAAEALLRWRHPRLGPVSPDLFVPVAEETGAIRALTEWTLAQAVADAADVAAVRPLCVAVNISARLLGDADFARFAAEKARGASLCFEITETAMMENPAAAAQMLADFAAAGVEISIDDFGARLSSFDYLQRLNAHELKIDKSFLAPFVEGDERLIAGAIELGHAMGLTVTVEGVESRAALERLAAIGADKVQGNVVAPPLTLAELKAFLTRY